MESRSGAVPSTAPPALTDGAPAPARFPPSGVIRPRPFRNDWSALRPPDLDDFAPTRPLSVAIPAHDCQGSLDLVLAALSRQSYPGHLMEVVIADDGSAPPLRLPDVRPDNCRMVPVAHGWGRANGVMTAIEASEGEIIHILDADMVVFPEHLAALARWHEVSDEAVALGYKRFTETWKLNVGDVEARPISTLFELSDTVPHEYLEEFIDANDQLRNGDHNCFTANVGATSSIRRSLIDEVGGLNRNLPLGEDVEFGYRLAQAGALFIPEPLAQAWHLGWSHMMRHGPRLRRIAHALLADEMAHWESLRRGRTRIWKVPRVVVVMEAVDRLEVVEAALDRLLEGDENDVHVYLIGRWAELTDDRWSASADSHLDLRLIRATFRSDPRVTLAEGEPSTIAPSPFLLRVRPDAGFGHESLRRLLHIANDSRAGLVRVVGAHDPVPVMELWRTAAVGRARRHQQDGEQLADVVEQTWGGLTIDAAELGLTDLTEEPPSSYAV